MLGNFQFQDFLISVIKTVITKATDKSQTITDELQTSTYDSQTSHRRVTDEYI